MLARVLTTLSGLAASTGGTSRLTATAAMCMR